MTCEAKITLKFDSSWEQTRGIYDEEEIPEEHITFECPAQDLNTIQLFTHFTNFARAIGHTEVGIMKGACSVAFNDMRSVEEMRKVAEEYDLKLVEDYRDEVCKLEAEVRDLKAKLSRLEQPDNPNYTLEAVEQGVSYGYCLAHKHVKNPTEGAIIDNVVEQVMNSLDELFDFEDEVND